MKIKISALTDTGIERPNNEDAFVFCPNLTDANWNIDDMPSYIPLGKFGSLLIVADGMGGANAGEVASATAINSIKDSFNGSDLEAISKSEQDICYFLNKVANAANDAVCKKMIEDPKTNGMGTTIVICWVINDMAYIAWCGDSRCYLYNPRKGLKLLTKDHSYVQELIDKGEITEEEAFTHPDNNIVTKVVGELGMMLLPDITSLKLEPNDYLLLCSDGLCGLCNFDQIENVLMSSYRNIKACRDNLLNLALDAGGSDNITIMLASLFSDTQEKPISLPMLSSIKQSLKRFFGKA